MSFQQGLSGLAAASKSLEAIGNNVANANTVGFKASQAQFADVYANSLNGSTSANTGIGTKVSQVAQQFTKGNITGTANPLDVAINGAGFFRMSDGGTVTYSRNGQFELNKDGYIVNANGARLTGYLTDTNGVLATGAPVDLRIDSHDLPPKMTTEVKQTLNLDSRLTPITVAFNKDDPATYHNSTSASVYDSLGNAQVLQTFYVKVAPTDASPPGTPATWHVYATVDGNLVAPAPPADPADPPNPAGYLGQLIFTSTGDLTAATRASLPLNISVPTSSGATSPYPVKFQLANTTQYGSPFSPSAPLQDGYESGRLSGFNIGADGIIMGRYTNGKTSRLGQVALANFTNPNGLQPTGGNAWIETSASGQPLVSSPGSSNLGVLQSSAVEDSNVDLTAELVNMITAQRVFQANSQTIKTQDQLLQTVVNLR